mmetsp:Transcript_137281/g.256346  ORF Transcript_137281/g.256346 Transcript_137281/m.256346 type:complete len:254 (+) Transcript_137281:51-812(+)
MHTMILQFTALCIALLELRGAQAEEESGPFTLLPLPYAYDALEPYIDEETMRIHHTVHHKKYIDGLNNVLHGKFKNLGDAHSLTEYQRVASVKGEAARNNGGGHYNHQFFFLNIAPEATRGEPDKYVSAGINIIWGSMEEMQVEFKRAALSRFGSGWVWLGINNHGQVCITTTANQDNPLMEGLHYHHTHMWPFLGCDLWEHAYYLKHRANRSAYIDNFWKVVNWNQVNRNYLIAKRKKPVPPVEHEGEHEEL